MLTIYENRSGALERQKGKPRITEGALWVDLLNPTPAEEKKVERALKFDSAHHVRTYLKEELSKVVPDIRI